MSNPPVSTPPAVSDNEIALLINGELEGAERDRVLKSIEADPESYAIFSQAARLLTEGSASEAPSETAPFPLPSAAPLQRPKTRIAAAVLAAAVVLLLFLFGLPGPTTVSLASSTLVEPAISALTEEQSADAWSRIAIESAPPAFAAGSSARGRAIRLGALSVDLAIARATDLANMPRLVAASLLEQSEGLDIAPGSRSVYFRLAQGEGLDDETLANAERDLARAGDPDAFAVGQVLQAIRLAASAESIVGLREIARDHLEVLRVLELSGDDAAARDRLIEAMDQENPAAQQIELLAGDLVARWMG